MDTQCALNRIESSLSAFTLNVHLPNPDLIRINPNHFQGCAIVRCAWGPKRVWHARLCQLSTVSASPGYNTVPHICSTREAIWWPAEVMIWWGHHGSCVEVWSLEVNVHAWIRFHTMQCGGRDRCTLDSHWIRIGQFGYWTGLNPELVWTGLKPFITTVRVFLVLS